jgi:nitrogen regulatory protein P-II 1
MKEISIYIIKDDLAKVIDILKKHNVGGIAFYEVMGAGRVAREAVPEMVRSYMTGRMVTHEHEKRTKVETIVPDSKADPILDEISNTLGQHAGGKPRGVMFIKDVSHAHEIGTNQRGEAVVASI